MIGIRQKLILGFGGLLAVVAVFGVITIAQIDELGQAIDVILKQNYRSVIACQDMKESLERMDSGLLFILAGSDAEGRELIAKYAPAFRDALDTELHTITLPGEGEKARHLQQLSDAFMRGIPAMTVQPHNPAARRAAYFNTLQPLFLEMKSVAQEILLMNQRNMHEANDSARRLAAVAHRRMIYAIIVSALIAAAFSVLTRRWILRPINRLIDSTNDIRNGNLDLVIEASSRDEIGRLSESFNDMTAALRQVRKTDRITLQRTRRATEEVFKALPSVIAVLDPDGRVEVSTDPADRNFGLKPGTQTGTLGFPWFEPLFRRALDENRIAEPDASEGYVQRFIDNREHFFRPMIVPIPVASGRREPTGAALILKDVTQVLEQSELKRGVVSTVSHQLKTPLTSLRMSIHLLLEERVGPLNEKQAELLVAARDESERLVSTLDDLLDLSRIEAGKAHLTLCPVSPLTLAGDAIVPFVVEARDKGVTMQLSIPADLPMVMADAEKMRHVYANLLSNALRFTRPGGIITLSAMRRAQNVEFLVTDTGAGIAPEYLPHVFEPFYRVPGQDSTSGVGLGLAIVREIVMAHGGEVGVESEPGRGSTFRFTLGCTG